MTHKFSLVLIMILSIKTVSCSVFGIRSEEGPIYEVVTKDDDKEIRLYQPYLAAETTVEGEFGEAQNKGFRILADYIFGNNKSQQKIAMTTPVSEKSKSESIAMTAPVTVSSSAGQEAEGAWTVSFSMPSKYTLDSLPMPVDNRVEIRKVPKRYLAAIQFTGFRGEEKNQKKADQLQLWLVDQKQYRATSGPISAGYNPPWTIPFLRRNEVLFEVERNK